VVCTGETFFFTCSPGMSHKQAPRTGTGRAGEGRYI